MYGVKKKGRAEECSGKKNRNKRKAITRSKLIRLEINAKPLGLNASLNDGKFFQERKKEINLLKG